MRAELLYESAVDELKKKLPSLRKIDYSTIDNLMQRISKSYKITGKKLHDLFVSKYGHTPDTWIKKYKEKLGEEGVAEGSLEANTPNPVVVVQDLKGKILDKVNLSMAVQKYKLGNPQDIKNQLAHQNYTQIGNYVIVSPMSGQPQDNTTQGVAEEKQRLDPKCWTGYKKQGTKMKGDTRVNNCVPAESVEEDWNKVNKKDKTSGMSQKAVNAYRRENPGSKLKTAVTTKPSKLKPGSKAANRRKSFCARMGGNKGPMKKPNGKPTPKALALRRWNCESIEQLEELVMLAEQKINEAKNLKQQAAIAIAKKKKGMNEGDVVSMPDRSESDKDFAIYQDGQPVVKFKTRNAAMEFLNMLHEKYPKINYVLKAIPSTAFYEGVVVQFPNKQQPTKPNVSPLQKKKQVTQRTTSQNVVPIAKKPAGITWKKLPKDVLKLANDWFWADMDDGGSASALDPKGYGSGTRNQLQFITAQLQQRGWNIDDDEEVDNVLLTNKAGQSVLLPRDDAYDFKGWAAGTNSHLRESVEGKDDVQRIKDFINWSLKTLNIEKPYPKFILSKNTDKAQKGHHTGVHSGDTIWVYIGNRNLIDIFRTIFHELVHHRQDQLGMIKHGDSYPGSPIEALADMMAGKYIKIYGKEHSEIFQ
jgi:hypothetical protein